MNEKLLTIIVPSYNMEKYLPKCLGSLIVDDMSLLQVLDIIVVNDGSKDRTSEIAHEFGSKHPGVFRVIDKANGNYGSCINAALPEVQGQYVKILDADDVFDTEALKDYIRFLQQLPRDVDLVLNDYVAIAETDSRTWEFLYSFREGECFSLDDLVDKAPRMAMHGVCYRTENLRAIQYVQTEGISYTDTEWIYLPAAVARKCSCFKQKLYRYLVCRDGQTTEKAVWVKNRNMVMRIQERMFAQYDEFQSDFRFSKRYLEFQIRRLLSLQILQYVLYVPILEQVDFWTQLRDRFVRYSFLNALRNEHVLFTRMPVHFNYLDVCLQHPVGRKIVIPLIRGYWKVRGSLNPKR